MLKISLSVCVRYLPECLLCKLSYGRMRKFTKLIGLKDKSGVVIIVDYSRDYTAVNSV